MEPQKREQLEKVFMAISGDTGFMWLWDAPHGIFYFSNHRLGTRKISGKKNIWQTLIYADDRKNCSTCFEQVCFSTTHGDTFSFFHRSPTKSGGYDWMLSRGQVIDRDEAGVAIRVMGNSVGMATLNSLMEMHDNATRIEHALDAAQAGLWDWNAETNEVYFSPRYAAMMGYTPENFAQELNSWVLRVHRDDIKETMALQYGYINSAEQGDTFESTYRFLAADGKYNWIMSRAKVVSRNKRGRAKRIIGLHTIVSELQEYRETLTHIAHTDQLTGLSSRLAFDTRLTSLTQEDFPVSMIYFDMDGLKLVNDNIDHAAGDALLVEVAHLVRKTFRAQDLVARVGGDEFVALLPRCPETVALRLMRNVRMTCRKHNANPDNVPIFLSMGIASTEAGMDLFQLQVAADRNMIQQKKKKAAGNYSVLKKWIREYSTR